MGTTGEEFTALTLDEQVERLEELAVAALGPFGLAPDSTLELLKHRENAVFRVDESDSGSRWVLRVHREDYQTPASIRSELSWMDALREAGLDTPRALAGRDGEVVQTVSVPGVPEPRHCDVLSWIEGESLEAAHTVEAYSLLGELHARLHRHSRSWSPPRGFTRQRWDEEGMLGEEPLWGRFRDLDALDVGQLALLKEARRVVLDRLARFGKADDRFGLIHADFMPDNVLIHDGRASVIDFDDCGFGWHLYDPATLFGFRVADDAFPALLDAWADGYRSLSDLPDEHLAQLPTFIMARCLVGLGWLHTRRETELARLLTGGIVELACDYAESLLGGRGGR
jgi:Ser/Thr protein kinase RdoA (MazF antagonist)